jgi:hypothetical protein
MSTNITHIHQMSSAAPQTQLRLTARGRRFLITLLVIPVVLALLWAMFNGVDCEQICSEVQVCNTEPSAAERVAA